MQDTIITLTKIERQLLLYEVFSHFYGHELDTILEVLPVGRRMLQRDVKDLTEAGLISVVFSKKEQAYVDSDVPIAFHEDEKNKGRTRHLRMLHRLGTLMSQMYNEPISSNKKYVRSEYTSCKQVYESLFPEANDRMRQRDFVILKRLGYPIKYVPQIQYYEFYDNCNYRDDFGVFREDGVLKRKMGPTDYDIQDIPMDEINHPEWFDDDWDT